MSAKVEEGTSPSLIGTARKRIEGGQKITGATMYVDDLQLPGMLHGRLVTSIYAHATIDAINVDAALAAEGVVAVYTGKDVHAHGSEPGLRNYHMLARDKVIYYGQAVAIVVATSESAAAAATELVEVDYTPLGVNVDPLAAMERNAPAIRPKANAEEWAEGQMHATVSGGDDLDISKLPDNVTNAARFAQGDVEAGLAAADVVITRQYRSNWVHQSYIEPHSSVAVPDPLGNLTVYTSTQGQFYARNTTADVLGLPQNRVKMIGMEVGGGFGGKAVMLEPLAGWIALRHKLPVKIVMTRSEEMASANPAPGSIIDISIGGTKDGTITGLKGRLIFDSGCYPGTPVTVAALMMGGYYRTNALEIYGYEVLTNKPGNGAYRAPGAPQATFAIEQAIDELARELGWDPVEFRLHNCSVEGDPQPNGVPWPRIGLKEILEEIRDHPAYKERAASGNGAGVGVAIGGWPGGVEPCAANIRVNTDGTLVVTLGSTDITGTNTVFSMLAAETFGMSMDDVKIESADTDSAPYAGMSGGSKVTYTVGPAVIRAAESAKAQVLAIAAAELEVAPDDLEIVEGNVRVKGAPDKSMTLGAVAQKSMSFGGKYEPVYGIGKSAQVDRAPGFSGQIATVDVDAETGQIDITRYVTVQDVGRSLNPAMVEGQIIGGTLQGIGFAMYEAITYDTDGQLLSSSLMDYAIPKSIHAPMIETVIVEVPAVAGPYGAKGIGEPPIIPGGAAIANAVADATGKRVTEMPFTPSRVVTALAAK